MHEKLLAAAVLPMPSRVLGLDLMPYSLGCELQLFREDNAFITLDRSDFDALPVQKQIYALIRAVNICAKRQPRWFWLWSKRNVPKKEADLVVCIAEFRNYLADGRLQFHADLPKTEDDTVRYLGEPELLRLYRFILAHVPAAEYAIWGATAWDFPYSIAKMLSQGHAESHGNLVIYNIQQKTHDDYHQQCENGRAAWHLAGDDDAKRSLALVQHPIIRELAGLEAEVSDFEKRMNTGTDADEKEASWPA